MNQEKVMERRDFLKEIFLSTGKAAFEISNLNYEQKEGKSAVSRDKTFLRPPGAMDESLFSRSCINCEDCINACPYKSIVRAGKNSRAAGTPIIRPKETPCRLCVDLPCIAACTKGVLSSVDKIEDLGMGKAILRRNLCSSWDGHDCQICVITCPIEAINLEDFKPVILQDKCVGCGICEHSCYTVNNVSAIKTVAYN